MILTPTAPSIIETLLFQELKALISTNRSQLQTQPLASQLQSLDHHSFIHSQYQMIARQN